MSTSAAAQEHCRQVCHDGQFGSDLMQWYHKQDRKEEGKEEEEEEEGAGESDRQIDWLCGMAVSVAS